MLAGVVVASGLTFFFDHPELHRSTVVPSAGILVNVALTLALTLLVGGMVLGTISLDRARGGSPKPLSTVRFIAVLAALWLVIFLFLEGPAMLGAALGKSDKWVDNLMEWESRIVTAAIVIQSVLAVRLVARKRVDPDDPALRKLDQSDA